MTVYLHPKAQFYFLLAALPGEPSPHGRPCQSQIYILFIQQLQKRKGLLPSSSGTFSDLNFTGPLLSHLLTPEPVTMACGLQSMGSQRVRADWVTNTHTHTHTHTHYGQEGRICWLATPEPWALQSEVPPKGNWGKGPKAGEMDARQKQQMTANTQETKWSWTMSVSTNAS